jgi:quinol monooxygenase YgiN
MILSTVRITAALGQEDDVVLTLASLLGPTRVEPGCASCDVFADMTAQNVWVLQSAWRTWEDLNRHLRSDRYRQVLALMELSAVPPEVKFQVICQTAGMEHVRAVRMADAV